MQKLNDGQKKMVDGRLLHWAAAYAGGGHGARLQMCSMFTIVSGGSDYEAATPIDDAAEEINAAVCNLPVRERAVIREFYLVIDSTAEQKYRSTGTNKDSFSRSKNKGMFLIFQEIEKNKRMMREVI